jgi:hypothetical protein
VIRRRPRSGQGATNDEQRGAGNQHRSHDLGIAFDSHDVAPAGFGPENVPGLAADDHQSVGPLATVEENLHRHSEWGCAGEPTT